MGILRKFHAFYFKQYVKWNDDLWPVHKYNKHNCHLLLTSGVRVDQTVGRGKFSELTSNKKAHPWLTTSFASKLSLFKIVPQNGEHPFVPRLLLPCLLHKCVLSKHNCAGIVFFLSNIYQGFLCIGNLRL